MLLRIFGVGLLLFTTLGSLAPAQAAKGYPIVKGQCLCWTGGLAVHIKPKWADCKKVCNSPERRHINTPPGKISNASQEQNQITDVSSARRYSRVRHFRQHTRVRYFRHRSYARRSIRRARTSPRLESPQSPPQLEIPGTQYLIAFRGIGGAIDVSAAQRLAAAQQRTLRVFGYNETERAASFLARQPGVIHAVLGFSAGAQANVLASYVASLRRNNVAPPRSITTVGLYSYASAYNNPSIPTVHFVDHSGQRHCGERNVVNLGAGVAHLDPRTGALAQVAALVLPKLLVPPVSVVAQIPDDVTPPEQEVANARSYLVATAQPGGTMTRLTPAVAISLLHPVFAVRLARAVRQARSEGLSAGLMSAYRPPAFGVGGFRDKFNSLHSYGLAVDMGGIGSPGSGAARRWYAIAAANGVYGPYGPYNGAEWNHYQLVPLKIVTAGNPLRKTITGRGPIATALMWLASGIGLTDIAPVKVEARPVVVARARRYKQHNFRVARAHPHAYPRRYAHHWRGRGLNRAAPAGWTAPIDRG